MATGNQVANPEADIELSLSVFLFANAAVAVIGCIVGFIEVVWLERLFYNQSFAKKLVFKFFIYSTFLFLAILLVYPIAASIELDTSFFDAKVWVKLSKFLQSISFISTIVSLCFSLFLSLIYAGISENVGYRVFINLITGKYHEPKEEERIFLFLDMKSSTTIAEQLGHKVYFKFLQQYYRTLSNSIIQHLGETYQYIGDEVIITWKLAQGLKEDNCIKCFFAMKDALEAKRARFVKKFGVYPEFKAGIHMGEVTTGEIGALKKEIFYTGDVLNTASRIQGLCRKFETDLLVSEDLLQQLELKNEESKLLGEVSLRGRNQKLNIYSVRRSN